MNVWKQKFYRIDYSISGTYQKTQHIVGAPEPEKKEAKTRNDLMRKI